MKCSSVNPSDDSASVTSTTLLRAACDRQPAAWEDLVRTYSRRMYRWCRFAGLQPADAADAVQEALRSVAGNLQAFRRDRPGDTFRGWLRRIVDNKVRDHYRGLARQADRAQGGSTAMQFLAAASSSGAMDSGEEPSTPPATALDPRIPRVIERVRQEVGQRNWRLFWRVSVDGQSAVDVGCEFGVTANTVGIVKMRVLRRLRAEVASFGSLDG
jgi:RNA polymerase sigma-70 factor, ECF subfamily